MIATSFPFDQSQLTAWQQADPLVQDYRTFFSLLDCSIVERWQQQRSGRGRPGHPESAYLKAFLLRIRQRLTSTSQLRQFLLTHPLLIVECGFHLVADETNPYGFSPQQTLPCLVWLRQKLRCFDHNLLTDLLASTVTALSAQIPGLGEVVAFDVKHIYAWVKENNPRAYLTQRYDKTQRVVGDPDCKLGVKRSPNQEQADGTTKEKKELIWGYGSGVAAATIADYGDVVLAEYTQAFNQTDITYFRPLYERTILALGFFPTHLTGDAAFDAWYVYQQAALHGGIAAVPLNRHGHHDGSRDHDGVPICVKGLRMRPSLQYHHPSGYRAQRFVCPLLFPQPNGQSCEHEQFHKGKGCQKDPNWEVGGLMRVTLDRSSPLYKTIYAQRTSCERINSQAKDLGIERPRVRNARSVAHLNTLIYITINLKVLQRAKKINASLLAF